MTKAFTCWHVDNTIAWNVCFNANIRCVSLLMIGVILKRWFIKLSSIIHYLCDHDQYSSFTIIIKVYSHLGSHTLTMNKPMAQQKTTQTWQVNMCTRTRSLLHHIGPVCLTLGHKNRINCIIHTYSAIDQADHSLLNDPCSVCKVLLFVCCPVSTRIWCDICPNTDTSGDFKWLYEKDPGCV